MVARPRSVRWEEEPNAIAWTTTATVLPRLFRSASRSIPRKTNSSPIALRMDQQTAAAAISQTGPGGSLRLSESGGRRIATQSRSAAPDTTIVSTIAATTRRESEPRSSQRNASVFRMTRAAIAVTIRAMKSGVGHSRMRNGIVVPPSTSAHISALAKASPRRRRAAHPAAATSTTTPARLIPIGMNAKAPSHPAARSARPAPRASRGKLSRSGSTFIVSTVSAIHPRAAERWLQVPPAAPVSLPHRWSQRQRRRSAKSAAIG